MIPHTIHIKNFLSYGDTQTVNFSPYHLICLSGKNGHGKSALLDAMTWALWGQARKITNAVKADQGLLRLGQTQMIVIFDFELNTCMYRVRREFAYNYGKPYAALEFGILNPQTNTIQPLTEKTIKNTQLKIEETLRLDFNSFINSAFLRQGQSNEFSQKSPKDRKEILATILGLNQYEIIRKRAMEKIKTAAIEQQTMHTLQEKITQELTQHTTLGEQLQTTINTLHQLTQHINTYEQKYNALEQEHQQITDQQNKVEQIHAQIQALYTQKYNQQSSVRTLVTTWRSVNIKQHRLPNQHTLETAKKKLMLIIREHQHTLQQSLEYKEAYLKLKEEIHHLEQEHHLQHNTTIEAIKIERERLRTEHIHLQATMQELRIRIEQYNTEENQIRSMLQTLHEHNITHEDIHKQNTAVEQQFEKRKNFYHKYIAHGNWLTSELHNLEQKKQLVHGDDPSCPLCEQNLSATRRRFLKQKFDKQQYVLDHQRNRITAILTTLKTLLLNQHAILQTYQKQIEEYKANTIKYNALQKDHERIHHAITTTQHQVNEIQRKTEETCLAIATKETDLNTAQTYAKNNFMKSSTYQTLQQKLIALEQAMHATRYNAEEHADAQKQLQDIEHQCAELTSLHEQIAAQTQRRMAITDLCIALKKQNREIDALEIQLRTYASLAEQEKVILEQKKEYIQRIKELYQQKESTLQIKGRLEAQCAQYAQLEKDLKEHKHRLEQIATTIHDYQIIATATGKDGIQALLIEDTIPEIEHEANQLLAKLTNNQAQLFIESLRDLKKGGTKETLDIKISDPAGIRPYELFSGGEAFRIDFALRIAISKLLARRAGTALQTLIIDEGFGSQDEEGLSYIMDAIYKIQDDFAKVIIVSHLSTMKDQFPVHFVVEKGASGSKVIVMEQG